MGEDHSLQFVNFCKSKFATRLSTLAGNNEQEIRTDGNLFLEFDRNISLRTGHRCSGVSTQGSLLSGELVYTLAGDMVANLGQQAAQKAVDQMALEKFNQPSAFRLI